MNEVYSHITELRKRLIRILFAIILVFIVSFYFSNTLFELLSQPLAKYLPTNSKLITTDITAPFTVPIRLSFFSAIILSLPVIFFQIWSFIAPGLYSHEKKMVLPITIFSIFLFFIGMGFCYFVFFPLLFQVFISLVPKNITIMTDMGNYLDFCLRMLLIFGTVFQIPIIIKFLTKINLVSKNWLKEQRPYFIILAFVIGMILTPPDAISMMLLAVPICLLFEIGIKL